MVELFAQSHTATNWSCWTANPGSLDQGLCAKPQHNTMLGRTSGFLGREGIKTAKYILTSVSLRLSKIISLLLKQTREVILWEQLAHQNLILRGEKKESSGKTNLIHIPGKYISQPGKQKYRMLILNNGKKY